MTRSDRAASADSGRRRGIVRVLAACTMAVGVVAPLASPAAATPTRGSLLPKATAPTASAASAATAASPAGAAVSASGTAASRATAPTALSQCTRNSLRRVRLVSTGLNVDRNCQLMYVTRNGKIIRVWRATTGKPGYRTRAGYWRVFRRVNGWQESGLYRGAWMYRPLYFSGGQAVHGSATDALVVPWPASHGCVRIYHANVNWLWRNGYSRIGTRVYVF